MHGTALQALSQVRIAWLQARHATLSQNVANADTPGFVPHDVVEPDLSRAARQGFGPVAPSLELARTNSEHVAAETSRNLEIGREFDGFETAPAGNAVVLEEQAQLLQQTQLDYQLSTGIYSKMVNLMRIAIGAGGA